MHSPAEHPQESKLAPTDGGPWPPRGQAAAEVDASRRTASNEASAARPWT
jgi:hypothetical protein